MPSEKWVAVDSFGGAGVPFGFVAVEFDAGNLGNDAVPVMNTYESSQAGTVPYESWNGDDIMEDEDVLEGVTLDDAPVVVRRPPGRPKKVVV